MQLTFTSVFSQSRMQPLDCTSSLPRHSGSYNTPLASSVQESYVPECDVVLMLTVVWKCLNDTAPFPATSPVSELCVLPQLQIVGISGQHRLAYYKFSEP